MTTCKGEEHGDVNGHKLEEMGNGHMLITPQWIGLTNKILQRELLQMLTAGHPGIIS